MWRRLMCSATTTTTFMSVAMREFGDAVGGRPIPSGCGQVGWRDWRDAALWAVREHVGVDEIAAHLGPTVSAQLVRNLVVPAWCRDEHTPHTVAPYLLSVRGVLFDDGQRVQCHLCGLWFRSLSKHVQSSHQVSGEQYRKEFGLPAEQSLTSEHVVDRWKLGNHLRSEPGDPWAALLAEHGYRDLADALRQTIAAGESAIELAHRLSVRQSTLRKRIHTEGLTVPTVTDSMLAAAREHVASGGNLSYIPPGRLRLWVNSARFRTDHGWISPTVDALARIDPLWTLNVTERAAHDGVDIEYGTRRVVNERLTAALQAEGFSTLADAVAWADEHAITTRGLAQRLGLTPHTLRRNLRSNNIPLPRTRTAQVQAAERSEPDQDAVTQALQHDDWAAIIDWAAAHGKGIVGIATALHIRRIDALEHLQKWWQTHPDSLTETRGRWKPRTVDGRAQCPSCRLWFEPDAVRAHHQAAH